jgi:hypothetical protein
LVRDTISDIFSGNQSSLPGGGSVLLFHFVMGVWWMGPMTVPEVTFHGL